MNAIHPVLGALQLTPERVRALTGASASAFRHPACRPRRQHQEYRNARFLEGRNLKVELSKCAHIRRIVAAAFGISAVQIIRHNRTALVVQARIFAMTICCELARLNVEEIGDDFGFHHATVVDHRLEVYDRMETDAGYAAKFQKLRESCRAALQEEFS